MPAPTLDQLKRATAIVEQIERLQADLEAIFSSSSPSGRGAPAAVAPGKPGRKPGKGTSKKSVGRPAKKKRVMSDEARARIAEAQRRRWAKQKKA